MKIELSASDSLKRNFMHQIFICDVSMDPTSEAFKNKKLTSCELSQSSQETYLNMYSSSFKDKQALLL